MWHNRCNDMYSKMACVYLCRSVCMCYIKWLKQHQLLSREQLSTFKQASTSSHFDISISDGGVVVNAVSKDNKCEKPQAHRGQICVEVSFWHRQVSSVGQQAIIITRLMTFSTTEEKFIVNLFCLQIRWNGHVSIMSADVKQLLTPAHLFFVSQTTFNQQGA